MLHHKSLIVFDLDGTLFNTLGDLAVAVNFALRHFGLPEHDEQRVRTFIGNGSMKLIERSMGEAALPENMARTGVTIEMVHKVYSDFYWEHCIENTEPYEGVIELVQRIADENRDGDCATSNGNRAVFNRDENHAGTRCAAMLTNKPVAPAQKILKKFGLENSFATYLCGDTTPERKPSPAGIYEILRQTGIAPEKAIMIGDDTPDVLAAKNAGIDCITLFEGFGKAENLLPLEPRYTAGHIKDFAEFI